MHVAPCKWTDGRDGWMDGYPGGGMYRAPNKLIINFSLVSGILHMHTKLMSCMVYTYTKNEEKEINIDTHIVLHHNILIHLIQPPVCLT